MNTSEQWMQCLRMFLIHLPVLIACLAAFVAILIQWKKGAGGSLWALLGFILVFLLCFILPVGQTLIVEWMNKTHNMTYTQRSMIFTIWGALISLANAAAYILLMIAVFAGRRKPQPMYPGP